MTHDQHRTVDVIVEAGRHVLTFASEVAADDWALGHDDTHPVATRPATAGELARASSALDAAGPVASARPL